MIIKMKLLAIDLTRRFLAVFIIGLAYVIVYQSSNAHSFMSHLGMLGQIINFEFLAGSALMFQVPAWFVLSLLVNRITQSWWRELFTASFVALVTSQVMYLHLLTDSLNLGYVTPEVKVPMLTWYIATTTNWLLALLAAIFYSVVKDCWKLYKSRKTIRVPG